MGIPKVMNRKMMTIKEISKAVGISTATVGKIINELKLPHEKYGMTIVVDKDNLFRIRQESEARILRRKSNIVKFNEQRKKKTLPPNNVVQLVKEEKVDTSNERLIAGMEKVILELEKLKSIGEGTFQVSNIVTAKQRDHDARLDKIELMLGKLLEAWGIKTE